MGQERMPVKKNTKQKAKKASSAAKVSGKPKAHGWEGHGKGKPPFEGAAPPIHVHHGGKYLKNVKKKGT